MKQQKETLMEYVVNLPFLGLKFNLYNNSTAGNKNANVFPLPVLAAPSKSLAKDGNYIKTLSVSISVMFHLNSPHKIYSMLTMQKSN